MAGAGIWGIGVYLPDHVRTNDWWPEETLAAWHDHASRKAMRGENAPGDWDTPGARVVKDAIAAARGNPFGGIRERRVLEEGKNASDMELAAAERAIEAAGVDAKDIDFVAISSMVPDFLNQNDGPLLHHRLGLRSDCMVMPIEGSCNGFQLTFQAADMIVGSGRGRVGLLVQSTMLTRLFRRDDPASVGMGDGATAQVVGEVAPTHGILGEAHVTDGTVFGGLVTGVPGKPWYGSGPVVSYIRDAFLARQMFLKLYDVAADVIARALRAARVAPEEVDFLAAHQPATWFRAVAQDAGRLTRAKSVETFAWAGNLIGCNLPLVMHTALKERLLKEGDLVCMVSGAAGQAASATVARWGGR